MGLGVIARPNGSPLPGRPYREHLREAVVVLREPPPAVIAPLNLGVGPETGEGKFVEEIDPQPGVDQRADDLAKAVLPLVGGRLDYLGARIAGFTDLEEQIVVEVLLISGGVEVGKRFRWSERGQARR